MQHNSGWIFWFSQAKRIREEERQANMAIPITQATCNCPRMGASPRQKVRAIHRSSESSLFLFHMNIIWIVLIPNPGKKKKTGHVTDSRLVSYATRYLWNPSTSSGSTRLRVKEEVSNKMKECEECWAPNRGPWLTGALKERVLILASTE
jgi:hypothetical protein